MMRPLAPRRPRISRTSRVQVSIRDPDHRHLETLARILDADDAVAEETPATEMAPEQGEVVAQ